MEKNRITTTKAQFDESLHKIDNTEIEYWLARELMFLLGYER